METQVYVVLLMVASICVGVMLMISLQMNVCRIVTVMITFADIRMDISHHSVGKNAGDKQD